MTVQVSESAIFLLNSQTAPSLDLHRAIRRESGNASLLPFGTRHILSVLKHKEIGPLSRIEGSDHHEWEFF